MAHVSSEVFPAGLIAQSNNRVERELTSITQRNDVEKKQERKQKASRSREMHCSAQRNRYDRYSSAVSCPGPGSKIYFCNQRNVSHLRFPEESTPPHRTFIDKFVMIKSDRARIVSNDVSLITLIGFLEALKNWKAQYLFERCHDADIIIFYEIKHREREKERKRKNVCPFEIEDKSDKMLFAATKCLRWTWKI